jgi:hypothetical protein
MSTDHETGEWGAGGSVMLALQRHQDEVCKRFHNDWKTGHCPRIEDYLSDCPEPDALLRELIPLDIDDRRLAGECPEQAEYLTRFPALDRSWLASVLADVESPRLRSTVAYHPVVPKVQLGRFVNQRFHARGGMGEVWRAEDTEIGREVALKRMRPERIKDQDRFLAEAQITGQLEHPAIVPVHDLGMDEEGRPFYVMKFVRGRSLKDAIEDYHSPASAKDSSREVQQLRLLEIFTDLCQAVAYAHTNVARSCDDWLPA